MAPEYTTCVRREDFKELNVAPDIWLAAVGVLAAIPTFGLSLLFTGAIVWKALHDICHFMLHGKLICLGEQECAIGRVGDIEEVGEGKVLFEDIDNDFSINLILEPFMPSPYFKPAPFDPFGSVPTYYFVPGMPEHNLAKAQATPPQGRLLEHQPGMPMKEGYDRSAGFEQERFRGYFTPNDEPVLHCECEGDRIKRVLGVLDTFSFGGERWCNKNWFFGLVCGVLKLLSTPVVTADLIRAWELASGGTPAKAGLDGAVKIGDVLVITGRWVYDAGHDGYNELHPVRTIQRIPEPLIGFRQTDQGVEQFDMLKIEPKLPAQDKEQKPIVLPPGPGDTPAQVMAYDPADIEPVARFVDDWCGAYRTAEEPAVKKRQQGLEQGWTLHPAIDGCSTLTLEALSPSALPQRSNRSVTLSGRGFLPGATASISGPGVAVESTVFGDERTLIATVSIAAGAPPSARDVTVTNPDGGTATCLGCFTVQETPPTGE